MKVLQSKQLFTVGVRPRSWLRTKRRGLDATGLAAKWERDK